MAGERMEKVLDAVVDYAREAMDDMGKSMLRMVETIEGQEDEIDMLREELELQKLISDSWKLAFKKAIDACEDVLLNTCEKQKQEINEAEASLELYRTALELLCDATFMKPEVILTAAAKELELEQEEQPACCAAGHCGTDKCGGNCKDEPKLSAKFTLGEYEQVEAKAKDKPVFSFTVIRKDIDKSFRGF